MLSSKRKCTRATGVLGPIARTLIVGLTVSAAGCSADVTRFDFSSKTTTSAIPVPPEPVRSGYGPGTSPRGLGLTEAPLPPSEPPSHYPVARPYEDPAPVPEIAARQPSPEPRGNYRVVGRQYKTPPPAPEPHLAADPRPPSYQAAPESRAETIEVQPGDTLYSIARRHGVPVAAIKDANGLSGDSVRPGQRLALPGGAPDRSPFARQLPPPEDRASLARYTPAPAAPKQAPPAATAAAEAPPGWEGRYTMRNGESFYAIAQRHRVSVDDLMRANGITDPTKVWAGTVLNVPGGPEQAPASPPPVGNVRSVAQAPPRIINAAPEAPRPPDQKIASRSDISSDAVSNQPEPQPRAEPATGKFRWPVRGKVLVGFGRRPDGTHNDGVNVVAPQGTEIHAADSGKVAYAGNELKGYGNLVLIRHANGWVSAYAHADQILVKANDEVRRGQVIAKVGRTGAVDQPQLHFELRQGSRPVDPLPHLD